MDSATEDGGKAFGGLNFPLEPVTYRRADVVRGVSHGGGRAAIVRRGLRQGRPHPPWVEEELRGSGRRYRWRARLRICPGRGWGVGAHELPGPCLPQRARQGTVRGPDASLVRVSCSLQAQARRPPRSPQLTGQGCFGFPRRTLPTAARRGVIDKGVRMKPTGVSIPARLGQTRGLLSIWWVSGVQGVVWQGISSDPVPAGL